MKFPVFDTAYGIELLRFTGNWFFAWLAIIIPFFILNHLVDKWAPHRRHFSNRQTKQDIFREIINFLYGLGAGILVTIILRTLRINGISMFYFDRNQYGELYYWLSFPLIMVGFDAYFYATHRFLHTKWMFKKFHYVHHLSKDIGPMTSVSFHPVESFIIFFFIVAYALVIPTHIDAVMFFFWWSRFIDTFGHSGYDYCFTNTYKKPWTIFFASTLHHAYHHQHPSGNFNLWLNWLDHFGKTQAPGYTEAVEVHYQRRLKDPSLTKILLRKTWESVKPYSPSLLVLAGALCFFLSTQRFQYGWLFCLFSFVPWFYDINRITKLKPYIIQICWIQFFIGLSMFGWMPLGTSTVYQIPLSYAWAGYFLIIPFCIPYFFLFFIGRFFLRRLGLNIFIFTLLSGCLYVTLDNALAYLDVTYSYFLYKHPALLSLARYGGGMLVTFCLVTGSELTVYGFENRRRLGLSPMMIPIPVFVMISLLLDIYYQPEPGREVKVGIISPKWEESNLADRAIASSFPTEDNTTKLLEESMAADNNDFYILPETVFRHHFYDRKTASDKEMVSRFEAAIARSKKPVFFGGKTKGYINSFYVAQPEDGKTALRYRGYLKIHPMPFGERVPGSLTFPELNKWTMGLPPLPDGKVPLRGTVNDISWGGILCNEIFYPEMVADHRANGSQVIIDLGNERAVEKTMAYDILVSAAVVRAIESAVPVVKSTISGISGAINFKGRVTDATQPDTNSYLNTSIFLAPREPTFFALHPTFFLWLARVGAIFGAVLVVFNLRKRRYTAV